MDTEVWITGIIAVGFVVTIAIAAWAPDAIAERIKACMTQPNMVYTVEGCFQADNVPLKKD
jgi:hypothetical protein